MIDFAQVQRRGQHSYCLGRSLCDPLSGAVLDGRRSDSHSDPRSLADVSEWHGDERQGRNRKRFDLSPDAMAVRFLRILMTRIFQYLRFARTSNSGQDRRTPEIASDTRSAKSTLGTSTEDGKFHDIVRHTPDQEQTTTYCSSVDPWHEPSDLGSTTEAQMGFDLFYTSGVTRGLPAMVPVALLYDNPDNAAAEIAYLEKRNYPISYVEMGEEADGQFMLPEDYGALYLQWATALHRVDPALKLGGPSFTGENHDIEVWADANGKVSWTGRFIDYLKQHGRMNDLAFFSFEHYPYEPCKIPWGSLYDEPELVSHIMQVWREDGVPANVPMFITESNLSSAASETSFGHLLRALAGRLHWIVSKRGRKRSLFLPLFAAADGARMQRLSGNLRHVYG